MLRIAGKSILLAESSRVAAAWLPNADFAPDPDACLYCTYDQNWLNFAPTRQSMADISGLELDEILAVSGLLGNYNIEVNRWDLFDPARSVGVRLQTSRLAFPAWEPTAPLANFLTWIFHSANHHVLHAATLGVKGRGVILAGAGGSGKSGTVLAGLCAGLETVGDDYVLVANQAGWQAKQLYPFAKQDAAGLERLGIFIDQPTFGKTNWQNKYVFPLEILAKSRGIKPMALTSILLPTVTGADRTTFAPTTGVQALRALAPSSLIQLSGNREERFKFCAALVRDLPAFDLRLGTQPIEIAGAIRRHISDTRT